MITGPLAFRSNKWIVKDERYVLTSPTMDDFEWPEPLAWADCYRCPKDSEGHIMIQSWCSCGIYATLSPATLKDYIYNHMSIVCVVEALDSNLPQGGNIWLHSSVDDKGRWWAGFTAPGAQIVYLVDTRKFWGPAFKKIDGSHKITPGTIAIAAVAQQFHVPVISWEDALGIAKIQWEKFGMEWKSGAIHGTKV